VGGGPFVSRDGVGVGAADSRDGVEGQTDSGVNRGDQWDSGS